MGRSSEDAGVASGVVAFMVAGVLFMASITAVLVTTRTNTDREVIGDQPEAASYRLQADSLAGILLGSPGYATADYLAANPGLEDWSDGEGAVGKTAAADSLSRLGLLDAQSPVPNMLDFRKFQNLRAAPLEAPVPDNDQLVNYEDAREVLGLTDGVDFHVRAYPALQSVQELLACQLAGTTGRICKDPNLKVTYIGDVTPPAVPPPPSPESLKTQMGNPTVTCAVGTTPKIYTVSTTIVNGGTGPTQFRAVFDMTFPAGPAFSKSAKSPIVAAGASYTMSIDVPAFNGRTCGAGTVIAVDLFDINNKLLDIPDPPAPLAAPVTGAEVANKDLWVESATYFLSGSTVKVNYDGSELDSRGRAVGLKSKPLFLEVRQGSSETGTLVFSQAFTTPTSGKGGSITVTCAVGGATCPTTALPVGDYTARLFDGSSASSLAMRVSAKLVVVSAAPPAYTPAVAPATPTGGYEPSGPVASEVYFLDNLVQKFCPTYWDSSTKSAIAPDGFVGTWSATSVWTAAEWTARCQSTNPVVAFKGPLGSEPLSQPGDVFPDSDKQLRAGLVPRLICDVSGGCPGGVAMDEPRYDITNVLVVGTGVDHNEMASGAIKYAIEDWVKGGGTLIVLGSPDQAVNWLMPILKTGIKSSSGGVSVPDAAHPVLHVPDELAYADYDAHNQVWDFRGSHDADELFTQVVSQGAVTDFEPIMAVSNPGAIQDPDTGTSGTVVLTTWRPYDLFDCGTCDNRLAEGMKFINNVLMLGYGDLYLDYGPTIPPNTNVIPAVRFAQIVHPDFAEPIQLKMNVFVFARQG